MPFWHINHILHNGFFFAMCQSDHTAIKTFAAAKVQQKFDIHKDFEIKIECTCIFIAKYLGMSTNMRPYFRGGTACRVGALEVHKLKKQMTYTNLYAIF